jgi:hypothetical protein
MLPVGLASLFLSKKWLYRLFVFWTLFSASCVANFGEGENGSGLQVWMFFGFLWLLRLTMDHLTTLSFSMDHRILRPCLWLIAFLFVACISLVMPLYIDGKLMITSPILTDNSEMPLYLTLHNFTQLLYLFFGGLIAICVAHSNLSEKQRHETELTILISAIFVSVWGLFQFFCSLTGIPYPDYIFNNSGSAAGKGFMQVLEGGLSRISSVAVEPSILALSLITLLPLTLPAWLRRGSIISVEVDRFCAVLFTFLLILSTSSTAYIGFLLLYVVLLPLLLRTQAISTKRAYAAATVGVVMIIALGSVAATAFPIVRDMASSIILDKSGTASGLERIRTITLAYGYFQQFPILGIGWGSATSHDLIVKLLSNVGILGTLTFLAAMLCILRASWRTMDFLILPMDLSRSVWFMSLTVMLFTSILIGFPLPFGNFWLVIGMAISTGWKAGTDRQHELPPEQA